MYVYKSYYGYVMYVIHFNIFTYYILFYIINMYGHSI